MITLPCLNYQSINLRHGHGRGQWHPTRWALKLLKPGGKGARTLVSTQYTAVRMHWLLLYRVFGQVLDTPDIPEPAFWMVVTRQTEWSQENMEVAFWTVKKEQNWHVPSIGRKGGCAPQKKNWAQSFFSWIWNRKDFQHHRRLHTLMESFILMWFLFTLYKSDIKDAPTTA